uniref:HTH_48 domain-containing protein n=1 Tax=Caenorhabditis japonica TaxID=281687 RepID=A0A8R1DWE6_CAEJA
MGHFRPGQNHLRHVILFLFLFNLKVPKVHRRRVQVYEAEALHENTIRIWFGKFENKDFSIDDASRSGLFTTAVADPDKLNTCGVTCCPSAGIWGEWVSSAGCNDTCGSCGVETRKRKCLSLQYGCACTGDDTSTITCATSVCLFPRTSCCNGFKKIVNITGRTFYCGPVATEPAFNPEQTTCCDPEKNGLWNEWGGWTSCSATCGLCGTQTRTRTCASAPYGCPCTGDGSQTQACGNTACSSGSACCAGKFLATGYDGAKYCQANKLEICTGTWTEWASSSDAVCNDTCGNCGTMPTYRYCFPSGCQCTGAYNGVKACGNTVCLFPRTSCCSPYTKKIVNKAFACA